MRFLAAVFTAALLAGCASTNVETMTRPTWEPEPFEKIVVYYGSSDLGDRKQVENRFAAKDSVFVPAYELFFAGEDWTAEEVREKMDEIGADAALVLNPKGAGSSTALISGQSSTSCTLQSGGECVQAQTTGSAVPVSKPHASFGAVLLDWQTEKSVWAASAESGGNAFADQGDLRDDFVNAIVESLRQDGFLTRKR